MSALPGGLIECWRCDGGQTEPGTHDDLCSECHGKGVVPVDTVAECVPPEAPAPVPRDEDGPDYDALAWLDDAWAVERACRVVRTAFRGRAA